MMIVQEYIISLFWSSAHTDRELQERSYCFFSGEALISVTTRWKSGLFRIN